MLTLGEATSRLHSLAIQATVYGELQALVGLLRLHPSLRHHLADIHPLGEEFRFNARFLFTTRDGGISVNAVFHDGKVRVGLGALAQPDITVRFKEPAHMRAFFGGSDLFTMLLRNEVTFDGNLSCLAKFGHLSADARRMGRKPRPLPAPPRPRPERWQDLEAPPAGEPCRERPAGEVTFLDDPYLAGYTLDDFPRIRRLLWAFRTTAPEICTERARLLTEFAIQERRRGADKTPALRQAEALAYVLGRKQAIIHDDDLLAGTTTSRRIGVVIYPELGGTAIWPELLTMTKRALNPYRIAPEDVAILDRQVFPFWLTDNVREWARAQGGNPECLRLDERFVLYFMWKTQAVSHTIADLPGVLARGLVDIQAEARRRAAEATDAPRRDFYRALEVALQGVLDYAAHVAARARELAAGLPGADPKRRGELEELARVLERVPAAPAETLAEAVQAVWLIFLCLHQESMNAGLSLGRLDVWLQPYLERDLAGVDDPAERQARLERALELTCALMLKLTDHLPMVPDLGNRLFGGSASGQVITLGGLTRDGRSAVCDMTWILLKATEMLRLRDPNMNARHAPGVNSEAYLRRLCEVNVLTRATPSLHNDAAVVAALEHQGFPPEDARDWGATGCVEPTSCGRHYGHTNSMMFNLVAPLEMALNDGVHPIIGERVGPRTGPVASFTSYEQVFDAYQRQLGWLIDQSVEANNLLGRAHQTLKPTPLLSALIQGPMESGRDLIDGGARYNSSGTAMVGLTDVVDSLAAIKTLVYERRRVDLPTFVAALAADFAGHEALLAEILQKVPKFGQDAELPQAIARTVTDFVYARYQGHTNYRGGRYVPGYWSMSNHVAFGILSGALPSGRRRGKAFTPGLTPAPLAQAPLTHQIRTVAGLDPLKLPNNMAFNCKVVPGASDEPAAVVDRMAAYVASYFELGGMQMQFNVMSTETLRQAMAHPEEYRDLLVRISGYNAYFVELNRDMQLELIERTEHALGARA